MTEQEAIITLNLTKGLGPVSIKKLLDEFGCAKKALESVPSAKDVDLAKELALAKKNNVQILTIADKDYPRNLKDIYDAPPVLYVKGKILKQDEAAVALVGARRATFYGIKVAQKLSGQLARLGITVVSGLARGIDEESHKAALKNKGRTIAVLGSGLNRIYPPENINLAEKIAENGAVVSEFPMDMGPLRGNFPIRNRIISGLSLGVVVVEAAKGSGSLITADCALEQNREVFAVPGNADSVNSQGANKLIKQGARLAQDAQDILEELAPKLKHYIKEISAEGDGAGRQKDSGFKSLSKQENLVYAALTSAPLHIDEVALRAKVTSPQAIYLLTKLQLVSLVKELPGKYFVKVEL